MKSLFLLIFLTATYYACGVKDAIVDDSDLMSFDIQTDLLLLLYDCKTDVDDLHSIAAAASLIRTPKYSRINYHAVAGSYGIQDGKYIPGNRLFSLAFSDRWSDAHTNYENSLQEVYVKVSKALAKGGDIWIAEAGQSDFSASIIAKVQGSMSQVNTQKRIHVVQHSDWNEDKTTQEHLTFVKENSNYLKIPDGNVPHNGSPGYTTSNQINWSDMLDSEEMIAIWQLAIDLANTYNGSEGRYVNKTIKVGGMDFSDFCEVQYILGLQGADSCPEFFEFIQNQD